MSRPARATSSSTPARRTSCTARRFPIRAGYTVLTWREPHGVTGHIIPWNYPLQIFGRSVGAALAAGNACVVKPAEDACLSLLRLAQLAADAGLPAGRAEHRHRAGAKPAARSPRIAASRISRSPARPATGARSAEGVRERHCPVTLELGGKGPQIVFADADLDAALPVLVNAIVQNAGQTCSAGSRLLVERSRYERVLERLGERFAALRAGPGAGRPRLRPADPRVAARSRARLPRPTRSATASRSSRKGSVVADAPVGRLLRSADAASRRAARSPARVRRGVRPRACGDAVRRTRREAVRLANGPTSGSSRACGRATAAGSCAWRARSAAGRSSSTTTARAAASSCRSAASSTRDTGARRGSRRCTGSRAEDRRAPPRLTRAQHSRSLHRGDAARVDSRSADAQQSRDIASQRATFRCTRAQCVHRRRCVFRQREHSRRMLASWAAPVPRASRIERAPTCNADSRLDPHARRLVAFSIRMSARRIATTSVRCSGRRARFAITAFADAQTSALLERGRERRASRAKRRARSRRSGRAMRASRSTASRVTSPASSQRRRVARSVAGAQALATTRMRAAARMQALSSRAPATSTRSPSVARIEER